MQTEDKNHKELGQQNYKKYIICEQKKIPLKGKLQMGEIICKIYDKSNVKHI
jgi:hypothetical protein